jgi:hypothetical protein
MLDSKVTAVPQKEGSSSHAGSNEVGWLSNDRGFMERLWSMDAAEWSLMQGSSSERGSMASKKEGSDGEESSARVSSAA